jgi:hypothetical protein
VQALDSSWMKRLLLSRYSTQETGSDDTCSSILPCCECCSNALGRLPWGAVRMLPWLSPWLAVLLPVPGVALLPVLLPLLLPLLSLMRVTCPMFQCSMFKRCQLLLLLLLVPPAACSLADCEAPVKCCCEAALGGSFVIVHGGSG